jgi:hypothetical protein
MTDANQLSLFGLDLRRVVSYGHLAAKQLAFGPELGLYARFAKPLWVWSPGQDTPQYYTGKAYAGDGLFAEVETSDSQITKPSVPTQLSVGDWAVWLPDDSCLLRELSLPASAEIDIDDFVSFEVSANSPFGWEDTRYGWRIVERTPDTLHLVVAITSVTSIDQTLSELLEGNATLRDALPADALSTTTVAEGNEHYQLQPFAWPQCWVASAEGTPIVLQGDAQHTVAEPPSVSIPKAHYVGQLKHMAGLSAAVLVLCLAILWVPAYMLNVMAAKADDTLAALNRSAAPSVALRQQLGVERDRLAVAQQAINERVDYHLWLNLMAGITPDTVHLQRASLEGRNVTITGLAENAADYMKLLTEDSRLTNVEVPTAFRRDRNSGLERFSVSFTLVPEALGELSFVQTVGEPNAEAQGGEATPDTAEGDSAVEPKAQAHGDKTPGNVVENTNKRTVASTNTSANTSTNKSAAESTLQHTPQAAGGLGR